MEMEAKDLSCFDEEMQPHHLHMFDKKSPEDIEYQVQNVATNNSDIHSIWCHV